MHSLRLYRIANPQASRMGIALLILTVIAFGIAADNLTTQAPAPTTIATIQE